MCYRAAINVIDAGASRLTARARVILLKSFFCPCFCTVPSAVVAVPGVFISRFSCRPGNATGRDQLLLLWPSLSMCCTPRFPPRILKKIRLGATQEAQPGRRRFVFSSSTDQTRNPRQRTAAQLGVVSWLNTVAESLFATLFPANCRLCSAPLVNISRLPVCDECCLLCTPLLVELVPFVERDW